MSTATLRVYDPTTNTLVGTLTHAFEKRWLDEYNEDGYGQFSIHTTAAELVATPTLVRRHQIVRVRVDGADIFAFLIGPKKKVEGESFDVWRVTGRGLLHLLDYATVYPEGGLTTSGDVLADVQVRRFDWTSRDYDDSGWSKPESHGKFTDDPWETVRPTDPTTWPVGDAEYIASSTDSLGEGSEYLRHSFTTSVDRDYTLLISSDDEHEVLIDGVPLLSTLGGGPFQWEGYQEISFRLPAGTHTIAAELHNLNRAADNPTWLLLAMPEAAVDGAALAQNTKWEIYTDATGGLWTVHVNGVGTSGLDPGISSSALESAIEGLSTVGSGNATVTGTGSVPANQVTDVTTDHTGGTMALQIGGVQTQGFSPNDDATVVKARIEDLTNIDTVTVSNITDGWRITFDGAAIQRESFTVTGVDAGLTGGTGITVNTVTSASDADPWIVEFVNGLGNTDVLLQVTDAGLTGGTPLLQANKLQTGSGASADVISRPYGWKVYRPASGEPPPGMTPGQILRILVEEAVARGCTWASQITFSFDDDDDSNGTAWEPINLQVPIGSTIRRVVSLLIDAGYDFRMNPDLVLDCAPGLGQVRGAVTLGRNHGNWTWDVDDRVVNAALVRTDRGWTDPSDSALISGNPLGRLEAFLLANVQPNDTASSQLFVDMGEDPQIATIRTTDQIRTLVPGAPLPIDSYVVGDEVDGLDSDDATVAMIVQSIAGEQPGGNIRWTTELTPGSL